MMALAHKFHYFIIFFFLVISLLTITTTTSTTSTPFAFKSRGRIIPSQIVDRPTPGITPYPPTPPTCPISPVSPVVNTLREVTFNFSNVGLQKIGPDFIKSDDIISLSLDTNNINNISPFAFRRMRNLHYLDLSTNKIPKNEILLFSETAGLKTLIINNNNDSSVVEVLKEYGIFENLKFLYLRNSQLKDMRIPFNVTTPTLTNLYLSNNSITSNVVFDSIPRTLTHLDLDSNSIGRVEHDKLGHLHELVMSNNTITKVCFECSGESISLKNAVNMRNLFLSGNLISEVSFDAFQNTWHLENLDLSNNKIEDLDKITFNTMLKIISLSLANNTLTTVPNVCPMLRLQILNLAGNRISAVNANDFKCNNMRHLEQLYLSDNDISTIESGAFFYLTELKYLDLSENHLRELPAQWAFVNHYYSSYNNNNSYNLYSGMLKLHLERNNFITLDDISLDGINSLQDVYLDENPILTLRVKSIRRLPQHLTFHVVNMIEKRTDDLYITVPPTDTSTTDYWD